MVGKGLPIIEATEPYAFHLDSANDFQSSDDYLNTVHLSDTCDNSLEDHSAYTKKTHTHTQRERERERVRVRESGRERAILFPNRRMQWAITMLCVK
ncbi:hypothetical protein TSMEX_001242 [Taenia solium]|eukprot:TsM_001111900 transcript=TsM_001111900 gene=TsM_001111900